MYEQLRNKIETEGNIGKIVSIDIETGGYRIDDDLLRSAKPMLKAHPGAALWGKADWLRRGICAWRR